MKKIRSAAVSAAAALFFALCPSAGVDCFAAVAAQDDYLLLEGREEISFGFREALDTSYGAYFSIDSGSAATVSVSGLPPGARFDSKKLAFTGAPSKSGVFYVSMSAKNKNGYKRVLTSKWTVGGASDGDYDDIGIDWSAAGNWWNAGEGPVPLEWRTGEQVSLLFWYGIDDDSLKSLTVSGLPAGLKAPVCPKNTTCGYPPGTYEGMLTKAGKYKIAVAAKYTNGATRKAVKTVIVHDSGSRYLDVRAFDPRRGTVSGSKVYQVGAKATISAKAAKGYFFAGWYSYDGVGYNKFHETASGDWRKASDSVVVTEDVADSGLCARFVSKDEDYVEIDCSDVWDVSSSGFDYFPVDVYSETPATVTVKGLPAGVTWNKSTMALASDASKLKPGVTEATITAKSLSGWTDVKKLRISVPNIESYVFDGLDYSSDAYVLTAGVGDWCVPGWMYFEYDTDYKISASGLPSGLKLDFDDGVAVLRGTPAKPGVYTVTLAAKPTGGGSARKATFTITVDPLPEIAIGTFNGVLRDEYGNVCGTFAFTSAANGRQSVKVVTEHGTVSLSQPSWNCSEEGVLSAYFYKYSKNESVDFWLDLREDAAWNDAYQMSGNFSWFKSSAGGEMYVEASVDTAQRNPFGKSGNVYENPEAAAVAAELASQYKSKKMVIVRDGDRDAYKLECADCVYVPEWDNYGTATLSVDRNGTVKVSGKLYGLYPFSASVPLVFDTANGDRIGGGEHSYAFFAPVVKEKVCTTCCGSEYFCATYSHIEPLYWFPAGD